ncbi:MAG: adenylate/guanylate cyclase domain-containing protein [Pseudomonadota bacterium]
MRISLRRRTRYRLWLFGALLLVTILAGPVYGLLFLDDQIPLWYTLDEGAVLGLLVWGFVVFVLPSRFGKPVRRLAFLPRMAVIVPIVLLCIPLSAAFLNLLHNGIIGWADLPAEPHIYLYVLGLVAVAALVVEITHIIGPRVLGNLLIGRYQTPVEEERVFLFIDLAGSSQIAQKLGDLAFQKLLSRFFFDIGETILEARGEIHAYIGDGVIVTWPRVIGDARPVTTFFAIQDMLARQRRSYKSAFAVEPRVRGAVHGGPVVMAACGDAKRAIVYFGDTLNTTARLEEQAKRLNRDLVATADFAALLKLPEGFGVEQLGPVVLRGRDREIDIAAFVRSRTRAGAPTSVAENGTQDTEDEERPAAA